MTSWDPAIADFAQHYSVGASPSTVRLRVGHLKRLRTLAPSPSAITESHLEAFIGSHHAASYRNSLRATMRLFFRWARRTGVVDVDPAVDLPPVRVAPGSPRPAPDAAFLTAMARSDQTTRFMLAFERYAGLRRAEVCHLHSDDIGPMLRVRGKGGKVRHVPLHPVLLEPLRGMPRGFLFPGKVDGHLSPDAVGRRVSRALPDHWTGHTLRHRFATEAYGADCDIRAVQELLGHASVATTMIYTLMPSAALTRAVWAAAAPLAA